jgi:hypothetical protein
MDKTFAFPFPEVRWPDGTGVMDGSCGMTKREFYAATAMAAIVSGICSSGPFDARDKERPRALNRLAFNDAVNDAVAIADALIAALQTEGK